MSDIHRMTAIIKDTVIICSHVNSSKELAKKSNRPNVSYYIEGLSTMDIYIRWMSWSCVDGKIDHNKPRFVIANISVHEDMQGEGVFTYLIDQLKPICLNNFVDLQVECVLNPRLGSYLERHHFVGNGQSPVTYTWDYQAEGMERPNYDWDPSEIDSMSEVTLVGHMEHDYEEIIRQIRARTSRRVVVFSTPGIVGRSIYEGYKDELATTSQQLGRMHRPIPKGQFLPESAVFDKPTEAWQEKPNRRAGFAKSRRAAKKSRRSR